MSDEPTTERDIRALHRRLRALVNSPISNRCVSCGHVRHNELGYCQTGACGCEDGTTVASMATMIRRDLPAALRGDA